MADPFISSARQDFQDTKADLRAAYQAGDITRDQFQEAKQQARDVFTGYKGDVRAGDVTEYSNPFANWSYTPTGGISNLTTGTTGGAAATTPSWVATAGDLYQYLNPSQEARLSTLAGKYAAGELEGREGKIGKLERLLEKGGLGSLESYFAPTPTYTAPTDLGLTLPQNITYQQLADYYRSEDPMRGYVAATQANITPEQYTQIYGGYQPSYYAPVATQYDIQNFLSAGKSDVADYSIAKAYAKDPNNPIFLNNPSLASRAQQVIYAYQNPIKEPVTSTVTGPKGNEIAGTGQYGYINGAPILNADVLDEIIGNKGKIGGRAFKDDADLISQLGWNYKSKEGLNTIQTGPQVLGLDYRVFNPSTVKEMDKVELGPEEINPNRTLLEDAAKKVGIDPTEYKTASSLYQAIDQATEGLYRITGQFGQWDPEKGSVPGGKENHASVMYREVNGQLVPISNPQFFKYTAPEKPLIGGFVGEVLGSVPFLPEIGAIVSGGNPAVYTALKAVQTASRSGDVGDVLTSAGLAYLSSSVIPQYSPVISTEIANLGPVRELANYSTDLANFVTKAGTNATISMGLASLLGKDPVEAGIAALISSGVLTATKAGVDMTNIPDEYKPIVSKIISGIITSKDKSGSLVNTAANFLKTQVTKADSSKSPSGIETMV